MQNTNQITLRHHVQQELEKYFSHLDGDRPTGLYRMALKEFETGLLQVVLKLTNNNQCEAAEILGISRGNLRNKIYKLRDSLC